MVGVTQSKPDERLLQDIHRGDTWALDELLQRYQGLVRKQARRYFILGADFEDVVQEGLLGVYRAITDYDETQSDSFRAFALLCSQRQMLTAIKAATRQKHHILNQATSLEQPRRTPAGTDYCLLETLPAEAAPDPLTLYLQQDTTHMLQAALAASFTRFEHHVWHLYVAGYTYKEISTLLSCSKKSVDNALQRAKMKGAKVFESGRMDLKPLT